MLTLTELTGIWPSVKATCKSFEAELPLAADLQVPRKLLQRYACMFQRL